MRMQQKVARPCPCAPHHHQHQTFLRTTHNDEIVENVFLCALSGFLFNTE